MSTYGKGRAVDSMMVFEVMGYTIVGYGYRWTVTRNGVCIGTYTDTWANIRTAIILKKIK